MSTTFQLRELKGAATGHYRLDSAELTSSAVAGLPLVSVQGGAALGSVQAPGGDTVLWAKLLGFGGVPVAGVPAVRVVADQPSVALAPNTDSAAAAQAAAIAAAATDATSKVAAEATARTSAISAAITALVNGAPGALDTLNELAVALTADEGAATTLATLVGTKMPVVVHGSTASTARPTSSVPVLWLGSVTPTNAVANDLLVDTATPAFKVRGASAFTLVGGTSVAFTDKGAWATTTAYVVGDTVTQSSIRYICTTAHTSGTFATDLAAAKWDATSVTPPTVAYADKSAWAATTGYVVGDFAAYDGTRYVCKTAHTSAATFDPTKWVKAGSLNQVGVYVPDGWGAFWKARRALAGSSLVRVGLVGDSLTAGQQASSYATCWAGLLTAAIQSAYGDGGSGFVGTARPSNEGGPTFTGSWTVPFDTSHGVGPGGANGAYSTAGGTATYSVRGTIVEVYYLTAGDDQPTPNNSATVTIDGGSAVTINQYRNDGTTGNKVKVYRVTGLSSGAHSVVLTTGATAGLKHYGVRGSNTTGVVVDNFGNPGCRSGCVADPPNGTDPLPTWWTGGPGMPFDLAVYAYGVNEVAGSIATTTTLRDFMANVRKWANSVQQATHGQTDMLFVAPHIGTWESLTTTSSSTYAEMVAGMRALAEEFGAAFVNLNALGGNSWDWMNDQGYWGNVSFTDGRTGTDGVHLGNTGHAWWYAQVAPIVLDTATPRTVPTFTGKVTAALSLTAVSGLAPKTIGFDASNSRTAWPATISSYAFDPGDGSGATTQASSAYSHSYTAQGSYTASVTVTDSNGQTATATVAVVITPAYTFQDLFTGTDSTLLTAHTPDQGAGWTVHGITGAAWNVGLSSNQLALLTRGTGDSMVANIDPAIHTQTITATVGTSGNWPETWCWYVDDSNYVKIASNFTITKVIAGSPTTVQSGAGSTVAGDVVTVTLSGTTVTVKKNGVTQTTGTVADGTFTTATKLAFRMPYPGSTPVLYLNDLIVN